MSMTNDLLWLEWLSGGRTLIYSSVQHGLLVSQNIKLITCSWYCPINRRASAHVKRQTPILGQVYLNKSVLEI